MTPDVLQQCRTLVQQYLAKGGSSCGLFLLLENLRADMSQLLEESVATPEILSGGDSSSPCYASVDSYAYLRLRLFSYIFRRMPHGIVNRSLKTLTSGMFI